jgi:hypothetical protein
MELKPARLTLSIDPNAAFERLRAQQDRTASQVVRQSTCDDLARHGVAFEGVYGRTVAAAADRLGS